MNKMEYTFDELIGAYEKILYSMEDQLTPIAFMSVLETMLFKREFFSLPEPLNLVLSGINKELLQLKKKVKSDDWEVVNEKIAVIVQRIIYKLEEAQKESHIEIQKDYMSIPIRAGYNLTESIKRHVVQIEIVLLLIILFQVLLFLQQPIETLVGPDLSYLAPFAVLALIPVFVHVTNPESTLRAILKWGLSGLGTGATIGGSAAGAVSGGLGAPAGALIGGAIGFVVGAVSGPTLIEKDKKIFTQGEAREFLIRKRSKYPELPIETIIAATQHPPILKDCHVYMFLSDGIIKCTKESAEEWLNSKCWKTLGH